MVQQGPATYCSKPRTRIPERGRILVSIRLSLLFFPFGKRLSFQNNDGGGAGILSDETSGAVSQADLGSFNLSSPASSRSCQTNSATWATPVAPMGCPLHRSPPLGLTGSFPPRAVMPSSTSRPAFPFLAETQILRAHNLGDGEAVVNFGKIQIFRARSPPIHRLAWRPVFRSH